MAKQMTQIKFTIEFDIVAAFKSRCAADGVSMASVIRGWMAGLELTRGARIRVDARPHRKNAVTYCIGMLNVVLDNESEYRDNIPEQFSNRYESAEHACDKIEEAIACLEDAF